MIFHNKQLLNYGHRNDLAIRRNLQKNFRKLHFPPCLGENLEANRVGSLKAAQQLLTVRFHLFPTIIHSSSFNLQALNASRSHQQRHFTRKVLMQGRSEVNKRSDYCRGFSASSEADVYVSVTFQAVGNRLRFKCLFYLDEIVLIWIFKRK